MTARVIDGVAIARQLRAEHAQREFGRWRRRVPRYRDAFASALVRRPDFHDLERSIA
ncbi:MAG: hypothetical protein ABIQ06_09230 [Caldimonas sp.]